MKKLLLLGLIIAGAFVFSSCKKNVACIETLYKNGNVVGASSTTTYEQLTNSQIADIENLGTYTEIDNDNNEWFTETICK